jgi:hypothetical protein
MAEWVVFATIERVVGRVEARNANEAERLATQQHPGALVRVQSAASATIAADDLQRRARARRPSPGAAMD